MMIFWLQLFQKKHGDYDNHIDYDYNTTSHQQYPGLHSAAAGPSDGNDGDIGNDYGDDYGDDDDTGGVIKQAPLIIQ